jgi:MerR family copper efflux transcriptional regulator
MDTQTRITIGAVARRAGVGIDTIRYYEREGLLPKPRRRASGYRDYGSEVVERLRFIRRAKDLGFTLEEIRELLALSTDRERGVKTVKHAPRRGWPKSSNASANCSG